MNTSRREFIKATAAALTLGPVAFAQGGEQPSSGCCSSSSPSTTSYPEWQRAIWRDGKLIPWEEIVPEDLLLVAESQFGRMWKIENWRVKDIRADSEAQKANPPGVTLPVVEIYSIFTHYKYYFELGAHYAWIDCILEGSKPGPGLEVIATVGNPSPSSGLPLGDFLKVPNMETLAYFRHTRGVLAMPWGYFEENGLIEPDVIHRDWPGEFARVKKRMESERV